MPRTIDHIVEMHRLATERRESGRPVWDDTLRIKQHLDTDAADDHDGPGFLAARDATAATIRGHAWFTRQAEFSRLHEAVDGLAESENADEFNDWLDEVYDLADYDRIWIG